MGLLRDNGLEVDAPSYARVQTLLHLREASSGTLGFDVISFPAAPEDWGVVVTLGFYQDDGEALFYLDLIRPVHMREGEDLQITSPPGGLPLNGVRPPT